MYTVEDRDRVKNLLIEKAHADPSIVSAALIGSLVVGGDRWSDLDLTFGVAQGTPIEVALEQWTEEIVAEFEAVVLFDLPIPGTIYRVFLLPGGLQVDLSFTAEDEFGARGPRFQLLFGHAIERPSSPPPSLAQLFGYGVLYVTHANTCLNRGRLLQAEHWIHEARFQAMTLACAQRGLDINYARGFAELPAEVVEPLNGALVRELTEPELRRALTVARDGLLREAGKTMPEVVEKVRPKIADIMGC